MNRIWMLLLPLSILIGCSGQTITKKQPEQAKSAAPEATAQQEPEQAKSAAAETTKPEKSALELLDQEESEADAMQAASNTDQRSSANAETGQDRIEPTVITFKEGDYKSPFTEETVLKLNAIVRRSKTTADEFDRLMYARTKDKVDKEQSLSRIEELSVAAATALSDIRTAVKELETSGEDYDQALLIRMVRFVRQVDNDIKKKIRDLKSETAAIPVKKDQ